METLQQGSLLEFHLQMQTVACANDRATNSLQYETDSDGKLLPHLELWRRGTGDSSPATDRRQRQSCLKLGSDTPKAGELCAHKRLRRSRGPLAEPRIRWNLRLRGPESRFPMS